MMLFSPSRGAARRGARFLDEVLPGWAEDVDVDRLDVASPTDCVLGQLGGYSRLRRDLGLTADGATTRLGFVHSTTKSYPELTRRWRGEIRRRATRRAAVPSGRPVDRVLVDA